MPCVYATRRPARPGLFLRPAVAGAVGALCGRVLLRGPCLRYTAAPAHEPWRGPRRACSGCEDFWNLRVHVLAAVLDPHVYAPSLLTPRVAFAVRGVPLALLLLVCSFLSLLTWNSHDPILCFRVHDPL